MALHQLNASSGGINRLRIKGGAQKENLYDLVNGYVDASGACVSRPGTVANYQLPPGTVGMCSVNGGLTVFSHRVVAGMPSGVTCEVLSHPTLPDMAIREIHFAAPFLGGPGGAYLYVVAEFENDDVFHYWLQSAETWEPGKAYRPGALVQPSAPNGLVYRVAPSDSGHPPWAPSVARAVDDVVVPTTDNGFMYTVTGVIGDAPKSGSVEPKWLAADGAVVYEDTGVDGGVPPSTAPPVPTLPPDVDDRYGSSKGGGSRDNTQSVIQ